MFDLSLGCDNITINIKISITIFIFILIFFCFLFNNNVNAYINEDNTENSKILINEIYFESTQEKWWIELFNPLDEDINITGWSLGFACLDGPIYINYPTIIHSNEYILLAKGDGKYILDLWNVSNETQIIGLGDLRIYYDAFFLKGNLTKDTVKVNSSEKIPKTSENHTWARHKGGYDTGNFLNDFYDEINPSPGYENNKSKPNKPPNIKNIENQIAFEDFLFTLKINASDPYDTLYFYDNSSLFNINTSTGLIMFIPSNDEVGLYFINITVIDLKNAIAWNTFNLTILNVNDAPTIIFEDINTTILETQSYKQTYDYEDVDGDEVSWLINTNATWLDWNPFNYILFSTINNKDVGFYWVNISIDDGKGGTDFHNFTITVISLNMSLNIDSDNDGYNDTIENLVGTNPYDYYSIPKDVDKDYLPDIIDPDIDDDGVPNEDDDYPYNPSKWKKQKSDFNPTLIVLIIIVIIILLLILFIKVIEKGNFLKKNKKKRE